MESPKVAVISTSINGAPLAYKEWGREGRLIVAGDHNTSPILPGYLNEFCNGEYLAPDSQNDYTPGGEHIGWRCVQRRNAALWHALTAGDYTHVISVDDDNHPVPGFAAGHVMNLEARPETTIGSRSGFVNTGDFCIPKFHQRGTPYGVDTRPFVSVSYTSDEMRPSVVVSQAQVIGDPDCDAVERICNAPVIHAVSSDVIITPGKFAAFNSQATLWSRKWAPVAAVLPGVGRYDDIFASFIFHRLARAYNVALYVGTPVVTQRRNEHSLHNDLKAELFGMSVIFDFATALNGAHISSDMALCEAYGELITAVAHILPSEAVKFAQAWTRAWRDKL